MTICSKMLIVEVCICGAVTAAIIVITVTTVIIIVVSVAPHLFIRISAAGIAIRFILGAISLLQSGLELGVHIRRR
jgi:hypothetical protein